MRVGGAGAGAGPARLPDDKPLLRGHPFQGATQAASVPRPLDVGGDVLRLRVVGQELEEVGRRQVRLVADAHDFAEGEAARVPDADDEAAQRAALGDEGDGADIGRHAREHREAGLGHVERHAVRPHEPQRAATGGSEQLRLALAALIRAQLREAGGEQGSRLDAPIGALGDDGHRRLRRHDEDGEVRGFRQGGYGRIAANTGDLVGFRIDRIDAAVIARVEQALQEYLTHLRAARHPNNRDRLGLEEGLRRETVVVRHEHPCREESFRQLCHAGGSRGRASPGAGA